MVDNCTLANFFIAMLHTIKIINVCQRVSDSNIKPQYFSNRLSQAKHAPALTVKPGKINISKSEKGQGHPQADSLDNQSNISADFKNTTHPEICVTQWRQELITIEETLHCIDEYMEKSQR